MAYNASTSEDYVDPMKYLAAKYVTLSDWQWNTIRNYTIQGRLCLIDFWESEKPQGGCRVWQGV